ncbi:MAG: ThuA domain-containing protein [Planctomycetes bacterium]|nr:ThuA domain-containing protein [Planctomycetota bacterium]
MRALHPFFAVALVVTFTAGFALAQDAAEKPRHATLVIQSMGFVHDVARKKEGQPSVVDRSMGEIAASPEAKGLFAVRTVEDVALLTPEHLADTSLVIFYTTGNLPFTDDGLKTFVDWVSNGGAFLGIHCATDTLRQNPLYRSLVGAAFMSHPWTENHTVTLKVQDPSHPAMKGFPQGHTIKEEIYQFRDFDPWTVRVLLSLDMQKTTLKRGAHVPVAWCKKVGKGKVFYTSLGHREDVWTSPVYRAHLLGAIRWLLGVEKGEAAPNPEAHQREEVIAKAALRGEEPPQEAAPPPLNPTATDAPPDDAPAPTPALGTPAPAAAAGSGGRPRDPWVFRSVLDNRARIVTVALRADLWIAYDATGCNLFEVWSDGVKFEGPVFNTVHGPQPRTKGRKFFSQESENVFFLRTAKGESALRTRWGGYTLKDDRVTLQYTLTGPDGVAIAVRESPEAAPAKEGRAALARRFTFTGIPAGAAVRLDLSGAQGGGEVAATGGGRIVGDGPAAALIVEKDGASEVTHTFAREG